MAGKLENTLAGRDVLRLLDLSPAEVQLVLETALNQKAAWSLGVHDHPQTDKAVAIIMEKPSLRTRTSFEVGSTRLGAHAIVMNDSNSAFSRGESVQDTTLVLERFVDCIVIRTFKQEKVEEIAEWASIPVVNALTDSYHPCQGLADLLTIREHKGSLEGLKMAYVGDGNNMANTYLEAGALTGMDVTVATPEDYACDADVVEECREAAKATGAKLVTTASMEEALSGADVVLTDTWASMGEEAEHDLRVKAFQAYRVDSAAFAMAKPDALFMHCLPAHRGEEVTDEVMDSDRSVIYDEAENRLHAQKALLSLVMA